MKWMSWRQLVQICVFVCALCPPALAAEPEDPASAAASEAADAALEATEADPPQGPGVPGAFDPLEGMDESGRIPAPDKPADLEHPGRWRYIPEGRLKPGNVFQRFLVSSFILPLVFVSSDIGFGGGFAMADIDFRSQRRQEFATIFASITTELQQNYGFAWRRWLHHRELPGGGVIQEERSFVRAAGGYSRTLTRRFFGLGPKSKEDNETSYTDNLWQMQIGFELSLPDPGDELVLGAGLRGEFHRLRRGRAGESMSDSMFRPLYFDDRSRDMGIIELGLRWDTRDSQTNPYSGWFVGAGVDAPVIQSGGDAGAVFDAGAGIVFPIPGLFHRSGDSDEENPPTDSLAFVLRTFQTAGDLPFYSLPSLGGDDTLRGYIAGRWRDRASWAGTAEYRFWFLPRGFAITESIRVERLGAAIFYDVGSVGESFPKLFSSKVRHSYGFGLRVLLERAAPFRLDFGFSPEGFNLAGGFGFSF